MTFNWFQDKRIVEAFQKSNKKYLLDIDECVRQVEFGTFTFTLRIHNGQVTDMIRPKVLQRKKYNL